MADSAVEKRAEQRLLKFFISTCGNTEQSELFVKRAREFTQNKQQLPRWAAFAICSAIEDPADLTGKDCLQIATKELQTLYMLLSGPIKDSSQSDVECLGGWADKEGARYNALTTAGVCASLMALTIDHFKMFALVNSGDFPGHQPTAQQLALGYRAALLALSGGFSTEEIEQQSKPVRDAVRSIMNWCEGIAPMNPADHTVAAALKMFSGITARGLLSRCRTLTPWESVRGLWYFQSKTPTSPGKAALFPACAGPCTLAHIAGLHAACALLLHEEGRQGWELKNFMLARKTSDADPLALLNLKGTTERICEHCVILYADESLLERRQHLFNAMGLLSGAFERNPQHSFPSAVSVFDALSQRYNHAMTCEAEDILLGWLNIRRNNSICHLRPISPIELARLQALIPLLFIMRSDSLIKVPHLVHELCDPDRRERVGAFILALFATQAAPRVLIASALKCVTNTISILQGHQREISAVKTLSTERFFFFLKRVHAALSSGVEFIILSGQDTDLILNNAAAFVTWIKEAKPGAGTKDFSSCWITALLNEIRELLLSISIARYSSVSRNPAQPPSTFFKVQGPPRPETSAGPLIPHIDQEWGSRCGYWIDLFTSASEPAVAHVHNGYEFLAFLLIAEFCAYTPRPEDIPLNAITDTARLGTFITGEGASRMAAGDLPLTPHSRGGDGHCMPRHRLIPNCPSFDTVKSFGIHPLFYVYLATQPPDKVTVAGGAQLESGEISEPDLRLFKIRSFSNLKPQLNP